MLQKDTVFKAVLHIYKYGNHPNSYTILKDIRLKFQILFRKILCAIRESRDTAPKLVKIGPKFRWIGGILISRILRREETPNQAYTRYWIPLWYGWVWKIPGSRYDVTDDVTSYVKLHINDTVFRAIIQCK